MRKLRTRQHVIEDLGFNHLEKQVLLAGYVFQKFQPDYGYDGGIHTYNKLGEYENGIIHVQLKSTDKVKFSEKGQGFICDLSKRDLDLRVYNPLPVLLVLYNAKDEVARYLHIQGYFSNKLHILKKVRKFIRVYLKEEDIFNPQAVQFLRKLKNDI